MAIDRTKIPVRVEIIDNVGVTDSKRAMYRKKGLNEYTRLVGQVTRGALAQGVRRFSLGDNVEVEAVICHNIQIVTIIIGVVEDSILREKECWCCGPCLVAGKILDVYAEVNGVTDELDYLEDAHYYADILVCQSGASSLPKTRSRVDITAAAGGAVMRETSLQSGSYSSEYIYHAIFSDYQNHQPGDSVLVLVQPLFDFTPVWGVVSPCTNKRKLADELTEFPVLSVTERFINSSGITCQIVLDKQIWDESFNDLPEPPSPLADEKYNPFRILPIKIESCLSGTQI